MMRHDLPGLLYDAIKDMGGRSTIVDACKYVWERYENQLKASGDLFFTWQYDIRWAATELRKTHRMRSAESSPRGIWELP